VLRHASRFHDHRAQQLSPEFSIFNYMVACVKTFIAAAFSPVYFYQSVKVSMVVGTLLVIINNGETIITEGMNAKRWVTALLTYLVPYLVSVHGRI
jgi:hypothetical protein